MNIPHRYNPLGNDTSQDVSSGAVVGVRGVFTYLSNGKCNQSAMSMNRRTLAANSLRSMAVSASGVVVSVKQYNDASLDVMSGGTVSVLEMMGSCSLYNSGVIKDVDVGGYCSLYVQSNASASDVRLNGLLCYLYVNTSAVANNVELNGSRSYLYVSGKGTVSGLIVNNSSAYCNVASGGVLSDVVVSICSAITFSTGASVNGIDIVSGNIYVSSGAVLSSVGMSSGAMLNIGSGAVVSSIDMSSGGRIYINLSEIDDALLIDGIGSKGSFSINGSLASNAILASVNVNNYASVVDCDISSGNAVFSNGGNATNLFVAQGAFASVNSKCILNTVNVQGSVFCVNKGSLNNVNVSSGGRCIVSLGGVAQNVGVSSGGSMSVYQNGIANGVSVDGVIDVSSFGKLANVSINSCGSVIVNNYGSIDNISLGSSAYYYQNNYASVHSIYCDGGRLYGTVEADTITYGENGAYMSYGSYITIADKVFGNNMRFDGGSRNFFASCQFGDGGYLKMSAYCTLTDCKFGDFNLSLGDSCIVDAVFSSGGSITLGYYASVNCTLGDGGSVSLQYASGNVVIGSSGYAKMSVCQSVALTMGDGGTLCVSSMTIPQSWNVGELSRIVFSNRGTYNMSGSAVSNVFECGSYSLTLSSVSVVDGGLLYCSGSNNRLLSLDLNGGSVFVYGNYASSVVIDGGGIITIDTNAYLYNATVNSGAVSLVGSNCNASSVVVGPLGSVVISGNYASIVNVSVEDGGTILPFNYARIFNATLSSGATLTLPVGQSSCYVTNVVINDGAVFDMAGGGNSAARVSVQSGGSLHVGSNCTASSVVSLTGAEITVDDGGIIIYA